jgi:hypothetical protein
MVSNSRSFSCAYLDLRQTRPVSTSRCVFVIVTGKILFYSTSEFVGTFSLILNWNSSNFLFCCFFFSFHNVLEYQQCEGDHPSKLTGGRIHHSSSVVSHISQSNANDFLASFSSFCVNFPANLIQVYVSMCV